ALTAALARPTNSYAVRDLAAGLSALAPRLEPNDAADALVAALARTKNDSARRELVAGMSALAPRLERNDAARTADALLAGMARANDREHLRSWTGWLAGSCVDPAGQSRRSAVVASSLGSLSGGGHPAVASAFLGPALEPLPSHLSTQELVEVLKHPLCVG